MRIPLFLLGTLSFSVLAADLTPEIVRETGTPQTIGIVHSIRTIPEACVRLEGQFTGDAAQPYRFAAVRTAPGCQARARLVDFAKAQPSAAEGWKFNDEIRIPSAACPSQQAIVRVWRKPVDMPPPKLDAQGRARIYLHEAVAQAKDVKVPLPLYAAEMTLEGKACRH